VGEWSVRIVSIEVSAHIPHAYIKTSPMSIVAWRASSGSGVYSSPVRCEPGIHNVCEAGPTSQHKASGASMSGLLTPPFSGVTLDKATNASVDRSRP